MSQKTPSPKGKKSEIRKEKILTISPTKESSNKRIKHASNFFKENENYVFPSYKAEDGFSATFSMLSTSNSSMNGNTSYYNSTLTDQYLIEKRNKSRNSSGSPNKVQLTLELTVLPEINPKEEEEEQIEDEYDDERSKGDEAGLKIGGVLSLIQTSENGAQEIMAADTTQITISSPVAHSKEEDNSQTSQDKTHESALIFVPIDTPKKKHKVISRITLHLSPNYSKVIAALRNLFEGTDRNGEHVDIGRAMTKEPRRHFLIYMTSLTDVSAIYVVKKNQLNLLYGRGPDEVQFKDVPKYFVHNTESGDLEECIADPYLPTDECIAFMLE